MELRLASVDTGIYIKSSSGSGVFPQAEFQI